MKILIGCEFSGVVRDAFLRRGHDAWSCDLLDSESEIPDRHIVGDVVDVIKQSRWDLIIMHPPCTAIACSGNAWYGRGKSKHHLRLESIEWTVSLFELAKRHSDKVAMENPVGVLPLKATQFIQPWEFGHGETKKTGLWLHGLPKLVPTNIVDGRENRVWRMPPSPDRWKLRSTTYLGIAEAMADQWGDQQ